MHIAILKGGFSAEREVSLTSGAAVEKAVAELGHKVTAIDVGRDIFSILEKVKPDVAFNALHGRFGEDGCIQGILEILKIPYTHSGVLASALAMDKPMAKKIFAAAGLRCANGVVIKRKDLAAKEPIKRPYVIKPLNEGSSVGVVIVHEGDKLSSCEFSKGELRGTSCDMDRDPVQNAAHSHRMTEETVLIEEYIKGREIQVAVLNDEALGAIEIKPLNKFYDYEAKYSAGKAQHLMPAPLEEKLYKEALRYGETAHKSLGCRGLSRSDLMLDEKNNFYILETNTQPGMTPLSLAPEIAAHKGINFTQLVEKIIASAGLGG